MGMSRMMLLLLNAKLITVVTLLLTTKKRSTSTTPAAVAEEVARPPLSLTSISLILFLEALLKLLLLIRVATEEVLENIKSIMRESMEEGEVMEEQGATVE